ncbi:hypothetical protein AOL_s00080g331 [Orbilia oligospora ATCC 24927]|uniref:F-box domain-containing protein n=1 Tax=Arthrobotrys oligospora (strain ATCC 24927 / CBS 115.81 / DSM 1491) TaxID=756982 RepID=G1XEU6_ARTOA|nr:hypothetical protein AOL_s00080g331 [Orbilia oligospora ATCC 24927]EGX48361.1 hypothetical protein AOL_s00080g331 [Orbilia oligospora ATCC 24927]
MANIDDVPFEILDMIQSNLPFFDLLRCQNVCQHWEDLFFSNKRKWHYDGVYDYSTITADGIHRLLKLYSGPGDEFDTAYQLVAFAKGRLLPNFHVYALSAEPKCTVEIGLGCTHCQKKMSDETPSQYKMNLSEPVVITDSPLLDEPLLYHKRVESGDALRIERTEEENIFFDWMQSYHMSLTHGSERLVSYTTVQNPTGDPLFDTAFIIANFDLKHPKYSAMTVREFIEDAWDDVKSLVWINHQATFPSQQTSAVTIALREFEEDEGIFDCWFLCWRGRPAFDNLSSPDLIVYLQGTEYVLKLYKTIPL